MQLDQLNGRLENIGLDMKIDDPYVTVFYIDRLEAIYDYFTKGIKTDNDYPSITEQSYEFIKTALQNPILLTKLCRQFNADYAWQAVLKDNRGYFKKNLNQQELYTAFYDFRKNEKEYLEYYEDFIFDDNGDKVNAFLAKYPRTNQALEIVQNNYKHSISLACKRVLKDREQINKVFISPAYNGLQFKNLVAIESTGSDTHKQGLQVLILTFQIQNDNIFSHNDLADKIKLVYKPRDIEIDSLICGQSASLLAVYDNYFQENGNQTLFEYLNSLIPNDGIDGVTLIPLSTYKFLPIDYGSSIDANDNDKLQNSYGYVEYLSYEKNDYANLNPSNLFDRTIIQNFYKAMGQLMATTALFSLFDIHVENLRVHNYQPYLIDLENSLVNFCNDLNSVGIVKEDNRASALRGRRQNRLTTRFGCYIQPEPYSEDIRKGFTAMMTLVRGAVNEDFLAEWFTRMENVISRQVPIATSKFVLPMRSLYNYSKCSMTVPSIHDQLDQHFTNIEQKAYEKWFDTNTKTVTDKYNDNGWNANIANNFWEQHLTEIALPQFFAFKQEYILSEYDNLDVPSYYHRIGSQDIMLFDGRILETNDDSFPTNAQLNVFNNMMFIPHYFSYPNNISPTQGIVRDGQLQPLTDIDAFNTQLNTFLAQINTFLINPNQQV